MKPRTDGSLGDSQVDMPAMALSGFLADLAHHLHRPGAVAD